MLTDSSPQSGSASFDLPASIAIPKPIKNGASAAKFEYLDTTGRFQVALILTNRKLKETDRVVHVTRSRGNVICITGAAFARRHGFVVQCLCRMIVCARIG